MSLLSDNLEAQLEAAKDEIWTQEDAIALSRLIEAIAPTYGAHVALTGGCLYKDGNRKDADILFYRIRQVPSIDESGLMDALTRVLGVEIGKRFGWVVKAHYQGKPIDLFFPESKLEDLLCMYSIENDGQGHKSKNCPECYKPLWLNPLSLVWTHKHNKDAKESGKTQTVHEQDCIECGKHFYWIDGYTGAGRCPDCIRSHVEPAPIPQWIPAIKGLLDQGLLDQADTGMLDIIHSITKP